MTVELKCCLLRLKRGLLRLKYGLLRLKYWILDSGVLFPDHQFEKLIILSLGSKGRGRISYRFVLDHLRQIDFFAFEGSTRFLSPYL